MLFFSSVKAKNEMNVRNMDPNLSNVTCFRSQSIWQLSITLTFLYLACARTEEKGLSFKVVFSI